MTGRSRRFSLATPPTSDMSTERDKGADPQAREAPFDLREALRVVRIYGALIVVCALVVSSVVLVVTLRLPRVYEASCTLEYDPNPPRPLGEGVEDVAGSASDFWMSREFFETQNRIIGSRLIAERVVQQLGLHQDQTFLDDPDSVSEGWEGSSIESTAVLLQSRVTVNAIEGTRLVTIRVRDRIPERAALIANTIAETFIQKTIEDRLGSTVSALEWLGDQLDTLRGELETSELALHRFKQDHNILSVSMEDRQNLVAQELEHFTDALAEARTRRIELQAHLVRLRSLASGDDVEQRAAGLTDIASVGTLFTTLRTKLAEAENLRTRYGPEHPRMQALQEEIATLRRQLDAEIRGVLRTAEADVQEASATEAALRRAVDDANDAGMQINLWEIEYARLNRQRENNARLYALVLQRTTETDLTRMLRTTHVRPVDRALAPSSPVSPRVMVNLSFGAGCGLMLGLAIAMLLRRLDRRLKSVQDAEDIGLTILGILPVIEQNGTSTKPSKTARTRSRRRRPIEDGAGRDLIVHTQPMSTAAESCRAIRTNLMFMGADKPLRSLVVTSASPREGKTTVATSLAISVAQSGKRVLVVDTDLRRPRVHRAFGVSSGRGVTTVLVGDATLAEVTQETVVPNLSVVACGPLPPNPAELLHTDRFAALIVEASARFDLVIFDSPPLGAVADAAVLAPQLDGVLVVVKVHQTTRDALSSVLRQLEDVSANIAGGVVNGIDPRDRRYENGAYYYYYQRDGYYTRSDDEDDAPTSGSSTGRDERPSA